MSFSERLKELREQKGLSQKDLAKKVDVSQASIGYWERGERTPSVSAGEKLANYFNVSMSTLLDLDDIEKYIPMANTEDELDFIEKGLNVHIEEYKDRYAVDVRLSVSCDFLNDKGKEKVIEYSDMIGQIPEYQKDK